MIQRLETIESLLKQVVADKASPVDGPTAMVIPSVDEALKRKKAAERKERMRLKERIRKSFSLKKSPQLQKSFGWLDFIFGISAANQRSGKEGSRFPELFGGNIKVADFFHLAELFIRPPGLCKVNPVSIQSL